MSNITLSPEVLATIAAPISTRTVKPANADLLAIADQIVALDNEGILAATIAEMRNPAPKPAAKRTRKPKAAPTVKTVDPTVGSGAAMAANWDGQMMKAAAGTITKGQKRNLARFGLTVGVERLSMVDASNIYHSLKLAA